MKRSAVAGILIAVVALSVGLMIWNNPDSEPHESPARPQKVGRELEVAPAPLPVRAASETATPAVQPNDPPDVPEQASPTTTQDSKPKARPPIRTTDPATGIRFTAQPNDFTIVATQADGKTKWTVDLQNEGIMKHFETASSMRSVKAGPIIYHIKVDGKRLLVSHGPFHSMSSVDIESGAFKHHGTN